MTPNVLVAPALDCRKLVPDSYRQHVQGAPVPRPDPTKGQHVTLGQIEAFADGQSASLDRANGRIDDLNAIHDACDAANVELAQKVKPKAWWHFW